MATESDAWSRGRLHPALGRLPGSEQVPRALRPLLRTSQGRGQAPVALEESGLSPSPAPSQGSEPGLVRKSKQARSLTLWTLCNLPGAPSAGALGRRPPGLAINRAPGAGRPFPLQVQVWVAGLPVGPSPGASEHARGGPDSRRQGHRPGWPWAPRGQRCCCCCCCCSWMPQHPGPW